MKPAAFAYHAPGSTDEALTLLAEHGEEAKLLAGGQSLVPLMNFRLARPAHLVDLNGLEELAFLRADDGVLRIGAMTRQRTIERSELVAQRCPLLCEAVKKIGHVHIRNRGTVGGSLAHADPAAELPTVMLALNADMLVRGPKTDRVVRAGDFFDSHYVTALEPDELLVEVRVPTMSPDTRWAFDELTLRHGDFAIVGVAALISLDADGRVADARLAFAGAAPTPLRAPNAERMLVGQQPSEPLFREAGEQAAQELEPDADIHASAQYRREMAAVFARRALTRALGDDARKAA